MNVPPAPAAPPPAAQGLRRRGRGARVRRAEPRPRAAAQRPGASRGAARESRRRARSGIDGVAHVFGGPNSEFYCVSGLCSDTRDWRVLKRRRIRSRRIAWACVGQVSDDCFGHIVNRVRTAIRRCGGAARAAFLSGGEGSHALPRADRRVQEQPGDTQPRVHVPPRLRRKLSGPSIAVPCCS